MCRVSGVIRENRSAILQMADHQINGGPTETRFWGDDFISLAHNRLAIVDIQGGRQPQEDTRWVVAYVGEIYNHIDMRRAIGPMHWPNHSDTYTLLQSLEHKGLEWTLKNAEGMYAFAAYDKFEKTVYLVVDPFSIKSMYYTDDGFASSPGALTHLRNRWTLNTDAVRDMLALGATREPLFDGMYKIPSGHYLKWNQSGRTLHKYYDLIPKPSAEGELLQAVKDSIQSIKMSDVPIHLFLSGGIDSTVIASQCPYIGAAHLDSPELKYAQEVADKYHNHLHVIKPREYNAEQCIKDYCLQSGDCSAAAIIPYIVSKEVCKLGKVAISANGSDETHFGYHRIIEITSQIQFNHIIRPIPGHSWGSFKDYNSSRELELKTYIEYDLNKTLDFSSMCFGLEIRVPYLNKTCVEMAMGVDYSKNSGKRILKDYLKREGFSNEFVTRPKLGFSLYSSPQGYEALKDRGVDVLKSMGHSYPNFFGRELSYYRSIAGNFGVWLDAWKNVLKNAPEL